MGRRKAAQNCTVLPWVSARADCKEGRFLQIGNSLLLSEAFQALSAGARGLYLCMALEAGGRRGFTFPLAAAKKYGFSATSFRRYVDELEAASFIVKHSGANVRQPNDYEFTFGWKMERGP